MNEPTLQKIHAELSAQLTGQKFGKIFTLSKFRLAIDFRLSGGNYLFISVEPQSPRIYLVERSLKELEKQSNLQIPFVSVLRKQLGNAIVEHVEKVKNERVFKLNLDSHNEMGDRQTFNLWVQLTGRSSNLFLANEDNLIIGSLRETLGDGQVIGTLYVPPARENENSSRELEIFPHDAFHSLSKALDTFYIEKESENRFHSKANSAKSELSKSLKKTRRLQKKLAEDLKHHGDPDKWKKYGDLLLANSATAKRNADKFLVVDYFDENTPTIEIAADENISITAAAEKYFKKYTKARNAGNEITKRLAVLDKEIEKQNKKIINLEQAVIDRDVETIESFLGKSRAKKTTNKKGKKDKSLSCARTFVSGDGLEILVGKRSIDNDFLTFRVAKSFDTWLHTADYAGSHVVIRTINRNPPPEKTLIEAAQLAAFYSKAKKEAKVAVHYTQKKFVNKPKGAAPGLVSLASFKTILVEPKIAIKKKDG